MTALHRLIAVGFSVCLVLLSLGAPVHSDSRVAWRPTAPRVGDVMVIEVKVMSPHTSLTGRLGETPLAFFSHADRQLAVVGLDVDLSAGAWDWQIEIREHGSPPGRLHGQITVAPRSFDVQRLVLPRGMVELDPETERRATLETERLRAIYRTVTPERLWRGRFVKPVGGEEPGTGFGARRIINGQPRAPHTGIDFPAPTGAPVFAANSGRIALVAEFFFPGRLAIIDHGLGLHTLYFHLDSVSVAEGQTVDRGQGIGTVGATGRATGPHLHFGAQVGLARVDPAALLSLDVD